MTHHSPVCSWSIPRRLRYGLVVMLLAAACSSSDEHAASSKHSTPSEATVVTDSATAADPSDWMAYFASYVPRPPGRLQVIEGQDGWLFFAPELLHLAHGPFWGDVSPWAEAGLSQLDPFAAIVDFHHQLEALGVRFIFAPVPAKAAFDPSPLPRTPPGVPSAQHRADTADAAFLERLTAAGVETIDLMPIFFAHRDAATTGEQVSPEPDPASKDRALYCRRDTHWSPRAIAIAAEHIAERIGDTAWRRAHPKIQYRTDTRDVTLVGDLDRQRSIRGPGDNISKAEPTQPETLPATFVEPADLDRDSPVLLLGDSHALVFHAGGDMHAEGAGLPEHLGRALGFPIDRIAVRGSGATPVRIDLRRRGDNLLGKKVVVWVLSAREYTQGQGWAQVPITDNKAAPASSPTNH